MSTYIRSLNDERAVPTARQPAIWRLALVLALVFALFLSACAPSSDRDPESYEDTVILISIDGFRADYLMQHSAPALAALAARGVHADTGIIPSFPSLTFPNHYSIVTGLYPQNHGIVSNTMYDRQMDERFTIRNRDAVTDPRWWGGEPIWVTAARYNIPTATYFWVGSEAPVRGVQPTYWYPYDGSVPGAERIDQVLRWLDLPADERPGFISVYFSEVDDEGHRHGTRSDQVGEAIARVDSYIARLIEGLEQRGIRKHVNLVILSDHGMADLADDRVIFLDDYIDLGDVNAVDVYTVTGLNPAEGKEQTVMDALENAHPSLTVYSKHNMPGRFHYSKHPRIPEIIGIADVGWMVRRERGEFDPDRFGGATHGYDNRAPEMRALFIADGPAFKNRTTVDPFENVHLYEMMAHILGIPPAPNDGDLSVTAPILEESAAEAAGQ